MVLFGVFGGGGPYLFWEDVGEDLFLCLLELVVGLL